MTARESLILLAQLADEPVKLSEYAPSDAFETTPASNSYSVTADAQIFLIEFAQPALNRVLLILTSIPLDDPEMHSEIWTRAAWRQLNIYWATRRRLIQNARCRIRLSQPQRIGLIQLFIAAIKMRRRLAERIAYEAQQLAPLDINVRDFDYVAEAHNQPFEAIPNTSLRKHSLQNWSTALDLLVRAISVLGDCVPGLVEYWDAIWARFDEIISLVDPDNPLDQDRVALEHDIVAADPVIHPELDAIVSAWLTSLALDAGETDILRQDDDAAHHASPILDAVQHIMPRWDEDGHATRLGIDATPVIHNSARLRLSFCERCECIYYAHSTLIAAAKTYGLASARSFPLSIQTFYKKHFSAEAGSKVWSDFIQSLRRINWDSIDRGFRENIVPRMAGAHLKRGAMELYFLSAIERIRDRGSSNLESVDTNFKASRVLSESDPEESGHVARQWSSNAALFTLVLDRYLNSNKPVGQLRGERMAALVLLVLIEQDMRLRACPNSHLLITGSRRAVFLDELEEESIVPSMPPITPWEMTMRSGRTCCLVSIFRRHYLVLCQSLTSSRIVLELPTLPSALLAWFVFHPSVIDEFIHPLVYARVHEIRSLL
jgi:hypothetical protein